jgi:preprotein translocase subunit SecE
VDKSPEAIRRGRLKRKVPPVAARRRHSLPDLREAAKQEERHMASKTTNPFTFLQQVRTETSKVTWPSRRETLISTVMVMIFATIAAIFFFLSDQVLAWAVELILGIGR